jgi:hypothetical protein
MGVYNLMATIGISVLSICGFIFLSTVLVGNWRRIEKAKGSPFRMFDEGLPHGRAEHRTDCFEGCMAKYAWDVDQTGFCTVECKTRPSTGASSVGPRMRHVQVPQSPLPQFGAR